MQPELYGIDLHGWDHEGRDLRSVRLDGANLTGASLRRASLENASLREAILYEANLDKCNATGASLEDADLLMAHGSNAVFTNANVRGARVSGAIFRESQLSGSDLRDTDLREAELVGSDLRRVRFHGALLWTADLTEADLRHATGMRFDETIIRNTKFAPRSTDRWSVLRRHYTGPRYAVTLLLLVAFVIPYLAKAGGWVAAARTQERVAGAMMAADARLAELDSTSAAVAAAAVVQGVRDRLPGPSGGGWRSARVWQLLLGIDKGIWYFLSTCSLLIYNVLRGLLTWVVGPMRDAEERSGVAPPHMIEANTPGERLKLWLMGGWAESYAWLWLPHQAVSVLFAVAAATFLFHAVGWLSLEVWIPV